MSTRTTSIMNTRRICVTVILLAGLLASGVTSQADGRFTPRTLKGTYGFSGSGTLAGGTVQAAVVGLNSFDGIEGCDITARLNAGGVVTLLTTAHCTYTVNPDGTGSVTITFNEPPFGPFKSDFVIVDKKEIHFVLSDEFGGGTVANGVAKRQRPGETD
jgi:hypothetical protein